MARPEPRKILCTRLISANLENNTRGQDPHSDGEAPNYFESQPTRGDNPIGSEAETSHSQEFLQMPDMNVRGGKRRRHRHTQVTNRCVEYSTASDSDTVLMASES
jgi:hypothetical protein